MEKGKDKEWDEALASFDKDCKEIDDKYDEEEEKRQVKPDEILE